MADNAYIRTLVRKAMEAEAREPQRRGEVRKHLEEIERAAGGPVRNEPDVEAPPPETA